MYSTIKTITTLEDSAPSGSTSNYRVTNICIHGDYLWFNYGKKVYKYSLTNYSLIATYTCDAGLSFWKDILVDDNYIYLLTYAFGTHVYRYSVSDGSYVDYVTLSSTYSAGNMAQDDDYIYVGMTYTLSQLYISKVDKATWTASNVGSTVSQYSANLLSLYDGYLFYVSGSALYPPAGLTKISVPDGILVWRDEHIIGTTYYPLNANLSVYGTIGLIVSYDATYSLGACLIELDLSTSDPTYTTVSSETNIYECDVSYEDAYNYWIIQHEEGKKIKIKKCGPIPAEPIEVTSSIESTSAEPTDWNVLIAPVTNITSSIGLQGVYEVHLSSYCYEETAKGIASDLTLKTKDGIGTDILNIFRRKNTKYLWYDADTNGQDLVASFYVDGVLQDKTLTINTTGRVRDRLDLWNMEGYRFAIKLNAQDVRERGMKIYSPWNIIYDYAGV